MRELVMSTVKMINSIRRKGGVHPVMSPRQVVTGRRMVLPPFPPGSCVYAVKGGTTNSIDKMRTFVALYLRPNDEGGGQSRLRQRSEERRVVYGASTGWVFV